MSDDATTGTCGICGERVDVEDLLGHLRGAHDLDIEPETWPDGSWVVVDQTLEPSDFADSGATEGDADSPGGANTEGGEA